MEYPATELTFEYHEVLNPFFWDDNKLNPEIRDKLLEIGTHFVDGFEIVVDVEDAVFTGSLANYNYTRFSDVDLHIITDFYSYGVDIQLLTDYFNSKKAIWNHKHNVSLKGHIVEVYIQDIAALGRMKNHDSTGTYSLKEDKWIVEPKRATSMKDIDFYTLDLKKKDYMSLIDYATLNSTSYEKAKAIKERLLKYREAGLERGGEYSPENLAYKELRRTGYIERLLKAINHKASESLSLHQEDFKQYLSFSMDKTRGPRHQSLTAGVNSMMNTKGKSVNMIAKSHTDKETPFPKIERLKARSNGIELLAPQEAQKICTFYGIDINTVRTTPRGLSTSSIVLGFNPRNNMFYLTK